MPFEFDAERHRRASAHQQERGQRLIAELGWWTTSAFLTSVNGDESLSGQLR
jgi:hypothetical protein